MATKSVAKHYSDVTIGNLLEEVQRAVGSICRKAYEFAAERGFATGHDLDDWLKAENELFFVPASELAETATEYILHASVGGFKPEQLTVGVEPQCVTVWGKAAMARGNLPDGEAGSTTGSRELFCQYRLPHAVVVERGKAFYDSGNLTITLPKQSELREADTEQRAAA
jgi:HSP20 family molecular chaperone IbpA